VHQEHHPGRRTRPTECLTRARERQQPSAQTTLLARHQQSQRADPSERAQLVIGKSRLTVDLSGARRDQRLG
jgi:hypothetical protein